MLTYCKRCVMPSTLPGTTLDAEGVCPACRSYEARAEISWDARKAELDAILDKYRNASGSNYDCIVPVSGGKDSTYQVLRALEFGMTPLCVTASTDMLTDVGRKNIENLKNLGVDYVEVSTNPRVRRIINRNALLTRGDNILAEHATIFTIPVRMAVALRVPLILWGENSQDEQGGNPEMAGGIMSPTYLKEAIHGFDPSKILNIDGIGKRDLIQYTYPSAEELSAVGVTGVFLGHYLPWDGRTNVLLAQAYGFTTSPTVVEGSCVNYENLDNAYTGIHDYMMFLKYGFGRASLIASLHVRRGLYSRERALDVVRRSEGRFPWTYMGVPLEQVLKDLDVPLDVFREACEQFTNRNLFRVDACGALIRDLRGDVVKTNYDNVEWK